MTSIDKLPNELLAHVFEYLHSPVFPQTDLFPCLLVTRRWHDLALPIVWSTLHLDFNWKQLCQPYLKLHGRGERGYVVNSLSVVPLRFDEFCRSLELQERKYLNPLQWCKTLTLGVNYRVDTASTAGIISTILRCNNVRDLQISLGLHETETLLAFRLTWGLIVRHFSRQQLSIRLDLSIDGRFSQYDSPIAGLQENVTRLNIYTNRNLTDCISPGDLLQFERLAELNVFSFYTGMYTTIESAQFWDEVENLPLKHFRIRSNCPPLIWNNGQASLPTSLQSLRIHLREHDHVLPDPSYFVRQLPNIRSLDLGSRPSQEDQFLDPDGGAELSPVPDSQRPCRLCQPLPHASTTHPLRILKLSLPCTSKSVQKIIAAAPLIEEIEFPTMSTNDDIVYLVSRCKNLKKVQLNGGMSCNDLGLLFLCKAKTLIEIEIWSTKCHPSVVEQWAIHLPKLQRVGCKAEFPVVWAEKGWEPIQMDKFRAGYGTSEFCCLEEEIKDLLLIDTMERWSAENSEVMKEWLAKFVRGHGPPYRGYLDMMAMRSDLMSSRD